MVISTREQTCEFVMAGDPGRLRADVTNCTSFCNEFQQQVLKLPFGLASFGEVPSGQRKCNSRHYAIYGDERCWNPDQLSPDKRHGSQENNDKRNIDECGSERSGEDVTDALELSQARNLSCHLS